MSMVWIRQRLQPKIIIYVSNFILEKYSCYLNSTPFFIIVVA